MNSFIRFLAVVFCLIPTAALADYPDPERKRDQVERFTKWLVSEPGSIVITGSSSIRRWRSIQDDLAPATIIPTGIPGSNINDLDHYLDELVLRFAPEAIVIYQGDNDAAIDGVSVDQVIARFDRIMTRIKAALPGSSLYVMSVKPSIARWQKWPKALQINRMLQDRADERSDLIYVDVATPLLGEDGTPRPDLFDEDMVHLNDKGYRVWTSVLQPILADRP
ncbi:MAG: GDSL-type esterase/lipase family protein [Pseudomonadota bacterium]